MRRALSLRRTQQNTDRDETEGNEPRPSAVPSAPRPVARRRVIPARGHYTEAARNERLSFLRQATGAALLAMQETSIEPRRLAANVENHIGTVEVPVGVAGPLRFAGDAVRGDIYLPLATTEGALVLSATRGAFALSCSGGVTTKTIAQRMSRAPAFVFGTLGGSMKFVTWLRDHGDAIRAEAERVSRYARLVEIDPVVLGRVVHVRFVYETADAAGQNMTTTCTWHACTWMEQQLRQQDFEFVRFIIEANMSGDKKVGARSFLEGRGTRAIAECFLPRSVVQRVLHVTPERMIEDHEIAMAGSMQSGALGHNINVANIIAGAFIATGQDVACAHESSLAQLTFQRMEGGLYASILLPSLVVGTVGGGTHLPRQRELLAMMDCAGAGKVGRLAEILAGFCLALDLSTGAAVSSGQFAIAHERLGRNRPARPLELSDFTPAFFERGLRRALHDESIEITSVEPIEHVGTTGSILTALTGRRVDKLVGHFPQRLAFRSNHGSYESTRDVLVKVKPTDDEVTHMGLACARLCGERVATAYAQFARYLDHVGGHRRELAIYDEESDPRFSRHVPLVYGTFCDEAREAYAVIMELLPEPTRTYGSGLPRWAPEHVVAAIEGIAEIHAVWYGRADELRSRAWLGPQQGAARMAEMRPLWAALVDFAADEYPEWFGASEAAEHRALVATVGEWWSELDALPKTLVHNDYNPRNISFHHREGRLRVCAYDWELATLLPPQHDLAELLVYVLSPDASVAEVFGYIDFHRRVLERSSGRAIAAEAWYRGFHLSVRDLLVNRIALCLMAHATHDLGFVGHMLATARHLLHLTQAPATTVIGGAS